MRFATVPESAVARMSLKQLRLFLALSLFRQPSGLCVATMQGLCERAGEMDYRDARRALKTLTEEGWIVEIMPPERRHGERHFEIRDPFDASEQRGESPLQYDECRGESPLPHDNKRGESPLKTEIRRGETPLIADCSRGETPLTRRGETPLKRGDSPLLTPSLCTQLKVYKEELYDTSSKQVDSVLEKKGGDARGGKKNGPSPAGLFADLPIPDSTTTEKRPPLFAKPSFDFDAGEFSGVTQTHMTAWRKAYPAIDVEGELAKAAAWLVSNPSNRKSDYLRFLGNWMSRAQDRAPTKRANGRSQGYGQQAHDAAASRRRTVEALTGRSESGFDDDPFTIDVSPGAAGAVR